MGRPRVHGGALRRHLLARHLGVEARGRRQFPRHGARGPASRPRHRRVHDDRHVGRRRLRERHRRTGLRRGAAVRAGAVGLCAQPDRRRALVRANHAASRLHDAAGSVRAALREEVGGPALPAGAHRRSVLDRRNPHRARHDLRPDPRPGCLVVDRAVRRGRALLHLHRRSVGGRHHRRRAALRPHHRARGRRSVRRARGRWLLARPAGVSGGGREQGDAGQLVDMGRHGAAARLRRHSVARVLSAGPRRARRRHGAAAVAAGGTALHGGGGAAGAHRHARLRRRLARARTRRAPRRRSCCPTCSAT